MMLIKNLMLALTIIFFWGCASNQTTPNLESKILTPQPKRYTEAEVREELLGKWSGIAYGLGSSGSGRTVLLLINEVGLEKKKVRGTYVRKYFKAPSSSSITTSEGENEIEADLILGEADPKIRWRGDTANLDAEFEFILKEKRLSGTRIRGGDRHQITMEKQK